MQEPLRIICVDHHRAEHGIAAQILTDSHLEFGWKCVSSQGELSEITTEFNPHIVLCTDELTRTSSHALLDALRLLCSQTPVILLSSMYEIKSSLPRRTTEPSASAKKVEQSDRLLNASIEGEPLRKASDAADLRAAFSAILESSTSATVMTDAEGSVTHANTRACRLLSGACQRTLLTLLGETHDQCPAMPHWFPVSQEAGRNPACSGIDPSRPDCPASEQGRHHLAYIDEWSLRPTLVHMDDLIGCETNRTREHREVLALISVDPDSGRIPDEAFDQDLEVAGDGGDNIEAQTRSRRCGSIVRIAADDFLVVLPDPTRAADATSTVHRLLDAIALHRLGAEAGEQSALAAASPTESRPHKSNQGELEQIAAKLNDAVQQHALNVMYQPQFDLKTGRGCGIEALARWTLASGDIIAPSIFIPIAEREGIIHALGAWMLKSACDTAYDWCGREGQRTTLSVNVSALQIGEEFCSVIAKTLERSRFPAQRLELEISESALIADPDMVMECLKQWKSLGIRIAMEDCGTGYSSLSYLSRLPVDTLKVHQSLIHRMTQDEKSAAITRGIVSLGAELGIDVIAQGVETEEQLQMLTKLGCPRVQGYLLARPMPAKQAHVVLRKTWGDRLGLTAPAAPAAARQAHAH
jgi:EAL domain-containing protein (putative c-di-GMP-specific phosphodiesterase class I)